MERAVHGCVLLVMDGCDCPPRTVLSLSGCDPAYLTVAWPEAAMYLQFPCHVPVHLFLVYCGRLCSQPLLTPHTAPPAAPVLRGGWSYALCLRRLSPRYPALYAVPGRAGDPAAAQGVPCAALSA